MNKTLASLLLIMTMSGCATESSGLGDQEKKLSWVRTANAQQDAEAALAKGDFRLMAMAQRHLVIPGISTDQSNKYELKCGVNIMQGISDVIRSEEHLKLMQQAHTYALQYNAVIKTRCKP